MQADIAPTASAKPRSGSSRPKRIKNVAAADAVIATPPPIEHKSWTGAEVRHGPWYVMQTGMHGAFLEVDEFNHVLISHRLYVQIADATDQRTRPREVPLSADADRQIQAALHRGAP